MNVGDVRTLGIKIGMHRIVTALTKQAYVPVPPLQPNQVPIPPAPPIPRRPNVGNQMNPAYEAQLRDLHTQLAQQAINTPASEQETKVLSVPQ